MTFDAYIWCFCGQFSFWPCDLDVRPFDFMAVFDELRFIRPTHTPIFSTCTIIRSWVMRDSIWSYYHQMERSLRPTFWNPWPQFVYSRCHIRGSTTYYDEDLVCNRRKKRYSHCEGYTVYYAVSRDLYTGGPKNTHKNFWPGCISPRGLTIYCHLLCIIYCTTMYITAFFSAVKIKTMMTMIMNICYTNLQLLKTK